MIKSYYAFVNAISITLLMILAIGCPTSTLEAKKSLPEGFVYLADVDPTIQQSVRYHQAHNFLGRRVNGYHKATIIITAPAAHALKKVQQELASLGYSLLVYDGYRPQMAVDDFIAWSEDIADQRMKPHYYPDIDKARVFELGYVAKKSGHSRGSTVDLTLIPLDKKVRRGNQIKEIERTLADGSTIIFLDDRSLDMGGSFDFFGTLSHHDHGGLITEQQQKNRNLLRDIMLKHGFKLYDEEWWHYTLRNEPFPDTYFNFPIE